jgi:hypothetical protein
LTKITRWFNGSRWVAMEKWIMLMSVPVINMGGAGGRGRDSRNGGRFANSEIIMITIVQESAL